MIKCCVALEPAMLDINRLKTSDNNFWSLLKELLAWDNVSDDAVQSTVKQILADVRNHLEQRFCELGSNEQNWENFQAIITEMGPPSNYVELLVENGQHLEKVNKSKTSLWLASLRQ